MTIEQSDSQAEATSRMTLDEGVQFPPWPGEGSSVVPYWIYTNQSLYEREQERIFGGDCWSYVALSAEIPNAGDFKRTSVGDRPVVVTRDEEGGVNVVVNRCAHRGVAFCMEPKGNTTEFMCPYHQWTYDLEGNLIGVPFRRGVKGQGGMPKDFALSEHGLQKLTVAERNGVIFATFSETPEKLEDYLGSEMLTYFDRVFDGRDLTILGYERQRTPANWKLMFENIKDPYHASLLHVFLVTFGLFRADQKSATKMDPVGRHSVLITRKGEQKASEATAEMKSFHGDLKLADGRLLDIVREFPGDDTAVMQTIWPNLIVQQQSNTLATRQLVTNGPGEFELHWTFFGYADDSEEMTERRLRQANLMGPSGLVSVDDSEVMAMVQRGFENYSHTSAIVEMGGRGTEDSEHMVTEGAIRAYLAHYRQVMEL